jgi:hypothetical protein
MTINDVTDVITALTGLVIAIGGTFAALKLLTEVRHGNAKTDEVHTMLNSAKEAADRYQEDMRTALQGAGVTIPLDRSLHKE